MPFPILFGTTVTTVLHYRADSDITKTERKPKDIGGILTDDSSFVYPVPVRTQAYAIVLSDKL